MKERTITKRPTGSLVIVKSRGTTVLNTVELCQQEDWDIRIDSQHALGYSQKTVHVGSTEYAPVTFWVQVTLSTMYRRHDTLTLRQMRQLNGEFARMKRELTQKEKQAVAALQGARRERSSLRAYAKKHKLTIQILYNTLARLRRQGMLADGDEGLRGESTAPRGKAPRTNPPTGSKVAGGPNVVCRIVYPRGYLIECTEWPPLSWLESLPVHSMDNETRLHNGSGDGELRDG